MAEPVVLPFDQFWRWLQGHPNCILNAGTPEAVLYDCDDFHWHFGTEGEENLLVQVIRGKILIGEIIIPRGSVAYVQGEARGEEEHLFECFMETEAGPVAAYYFVLSHGYSAEELASTSRQGRWVH